MKKQWSVGLVSLVVLIFGINFQEQKNAAKITDLKATVLLISLDGFRWDYMDKTDTPNLHRLTRSGVRAQRLIPSFPSKTFPNHYTIVTGLYPENNGIISNNMWDPDMNASFSMKNSKDTRWWGGEPLWITAEKQGQISATYFWPGSEVEIAERHPTYSLRYDGKVPDTSRVDHVLHWLDLPARERPTFITLYFSASDETGHKYGPDSDEMIKTIQHLDEIIGRLAGGLESRGIFDKINIIIISDHGMSKVDRQHIIYLDDYVDSTSVRIQMESPIAALRSKNGKDESLYEALVNAHPHLKVYNKNTMPPRFHYTKSRRIAPILVIADEGWSVSDHKYIEKHKDRFTGGEHGYDNQLVSMGATFIAHGPAFKKGLVVEPFENIQIYNLMAFILGLKPAPNDGSLDTVRNMLNQ